jgi:hypothetical protein
MKRRISTITILFCVVLILPAQSSYHYYDASAELGVAVTGKNRGVAVADYDGDGWDDFYVSVWAGPNLLFRNLKGEGFEERAVLAGLPVGGNSWASTWGDLNNDGFPELYVSRYEAPDLLFLNNGDGTFTDITLAARIGNLGKPYSVNMVDYDRDGWLDIYVANFRSQNALFRNNGDLTFSNYIYPSGAVDDQTNAMGSLFFDSDLDGDQDLYLIHDGQTYIYYENNGDGSFTDRSAESGLNYTGFGMGVASGDINRDGYPDIYVTNLYENNLFLNNGDGTFTDIAADAGVADYGMGWGVSFLDYDNDGWQDIYIANDSWFSPYPNVLYRNMGDLTFEKVEVSGPVSGMQGSYGTAVFDVNRDGYSEIALANSGSGDYFQLFLNRSMDNRFIGLELQGKESNRMAVGTRLRGKDSSGNWHSAEVRAGSGFASQSSAHQLWGLGEATELDSLWVFWPSGKNDFHTNLVSGVRYLIVEGQPARVEETLSVGTKTLIDRDILRFFPNPVSDQLNLSVSNPAIGTVEWSIFDLWGKLFARKTMEGNATSLDVSTLPKGLYMLHCHSDHFSQSLKFVKE